ncbi:hypothetical protein AVDCRST_MAG81-69, partial [uncultured Synechococcales cyanobacterium]
MDIGGCEDIGSGLQVPLDAPQGFAQSIRLFLVE